jgi:hypothetical protein
MADINVRRIRSCRCISLVQSDDVEEEKANRMNQSIAALQPPPTTIAILTALNQVYFTQPCKQHLSSNNTILDFTMKSSNALQQQKESPNLIVATSSTASEHWLPFVSLVNQSTIYRRHEARLARSYALRDDPRPAALRVLSGLPGFRIIVPPYQAGESEQLHPSPPRIGDFSEETVFSTVDDAQQHNNARITIRSSFTTQQQVLSAMLATLAAGGMGEYLLGGHIASKAISPFANSTAQAGNTSYSPFLRANSDSSLGVYLFKRRQHPVSSIATAVKPSIAMSAAAGSTALLFGSKVLLEQSLLQTTHDNTATISSSLLSSALAGGVVGLANVIVSAVVAARRSGTMPSSLYSTTAAAGPQNVIGRQMLAATLYFAAYDGVSLLFSSSNEKKSTAQIMTSGAVAGSVQAAVLRHGMISAAARAAPIHAMVFFAYESMKEGMQR